MDGYDQILERAFALAKHQQPDQPVQRQAGFANAVSYALTGMSGGYGGPSMREHYASRVIARHRGVRITFERACKLLEDVFFGPLTQEMALIQYDEYCFDDAPEDLQTAAGLLGNN